MDFLSGVQMVWLVIVGRQLDMNTDEFFVVVGSGGTDDDDDILVFSNGGLNDKSKV